jgi:hypothetical protein
VTERLLVPVAIVAVVAVARVFLATEGSTPPGQPALEHLTSAVALKAHFNRDPTEMRVLLLLAPSCSYCLKGATVIERILRDRSSQPVNVLVVWQPMLPTDWGRPGSGSLRRLSDPRVRQFWDADRTVAHALKASFAEHEDSLGCCVTDGVWWDLIAVFPPGAEWKDRFPEPVLIDGTVEEVADRFTEVLGRGRE